MSINVGLQYPIFGPEILCPHCQQPIPALTLTDTYLCSRHGAFEADPESKELVHLQSGRHWRRWNERWYRQHTHPDGIRFEIHEALDKLYGQGFRATKVVIAHRYQELVSNYLERNSTWQTGTEPKAPKLYGLPVEFSAESAADPCWDVINFNLEKEPGVPARYPYHRMFD
ncbi:MAG: TIGR02652 family protein [Cyanobacteria bacterium P01_H01_bin.15]